MFQQIVVPLDGSVRAEQALPVAAHIARASGGSVLLLQVVTTPHWLRKCSCRQPISSPPFLFLPKGHCISSR